MKYTKKLLSLVLVLVLALALAVPGFAAPGDPGTIQIDNATIGSNYTAYQILRATMDSSEKNISYVISTSDPWYKVVSGVGLVPTEGDDAVDETPFTLTRQGGTGDFYVTVKSGFDGKAVSDYLVKYMSQINAASSIKMEVESATSSTISEAVPYGYYLVITGGAEALVSLDSASPTAYIVDKNQTPSWGEGGKKVNGSTDVSYNVGDTVPFTVTLAEAYNYNGEDAIYQYTVTDNMGNGAFSLIEGQNYNGITVIVNEGCTTDNDYDQNYEKTLTYSADPGKDQFGVSKSGSSYTITIPWCVEKDEGEETLPSDFYYSIPEGKDAATITVKYNAILNTDVGESTNTATFGYNDQTGTGSEVDVWNYQITIDKQDGDENPLPGATFVLYSKEKDGEYSDPVYFTYNAEKNEYTYAKDASVEGAKIEITSADETGAYQRMILKGLKEGTYYLVETIAPEGYNIAANAEELTVGGENHEDDSTTVINLKGTELPSTGGMGTTIFYTLGGVLVVGAAILLVTKKRVHDVEG